MHQLTKYVAAWFHTTTVQNETELSRKGKYLDMASPGWRHLDNRETINWYVWVQRWSFVRVTDIQIVNVCLQCLALPMNIAMFCLSGVIARLGASGDQWAVPETMSRRTLPYWPPSGDTWPELTRDSACLLPAELLEYTEYLLVTAKLKVSQIQIREK